MKKLKELISEQHWMIHDLVDGGQIFNDEEEKLYELYEDAKKEYKEFMDVVREVSKSYECYAAQNKPKEEWDEYDEMMYPRWIKLLEFLDE